MNKNPELPILFVKFHGNPKMYILNQSVHNDVRLSTRLMVSEREPGDNTKLLHNVELQIEYINSQIRNGSPLGHIIEVVATSHYFANHMPLMARENLPLLFLYKYVLNNALKMKRMIKKQGNKKITLYSGAINSGTLRELINSVENEDFGNVKSTKGMDVPMKKIRKMKILWRED